MIQDLEKSLQSQTKESERKALRLQYTLFLFCFVQYGTNHFFPRLQNTYLKLLLSEPEFAEAAMVEQSMWKNCFYKQIETARRSLKKVSLKSETTWVVSVKIVTSIFVPIE